MARGGFKLPPFQGEDRGGDGVIGRGTPSPHPPPDLPIERGGNIRLTPHRFYAIKYWRTKSDVTAAHGPAQVGQHSMPGWSEGGLVAGSCLVGRRRLHGRPRLRASDDGVPRGLQGSRGLENRAAAG